MPQWVGGSDNEDQRMRNDEDNRMPIGDDDDDVRMPAYEDDVDKRRKVHCSFRKSFLLSYWVLGSPSGEEAS